MANRYVERRIKFISYLGDKCNKCESTEFLEIDHIDRTTKNFDIGKAIAGWSDSRILKELDKCQLLCKSCHKEKSDEEMRVEHGGGSSGRRNCKCELCKSKKSEYMKNRTKTGKRIKDRICKSEECSILIDRRNNSGFCRSCSMKIRRSATKFP